MRSIAATFVLALAAAAICGVAGWQWSQGNFNSLFGTPPVPVGQRIYSGFKASEVKHIRISDGKTSGTFSLLENGWQALTPWADRMDPRAAVGIINFTLGLRVEDFAQEERMDPNRAGLKENAISIRLENANHEPLAKYKLGRVTPWKAKVEGFEQPVPTVFVLPRDVNHRHYVYSCTGDITTLFKDGLKFLRDQRPFYFNPVNLRKIRIRSQQGDLTLGRESLQTPWRIVKPLDLPTNPARMKSLLEGLYELQAVKVSDRASLTLPATDSAVKTGLIALEPFGAKAETLLEIYPPEKPDAHDVKATVNDRPNTVFDLPLKPESGLVSLADLPLSVNDLRDPMLSRLNIGALREISIQPATGTEIVISHTSPKKWIATIVGTEVEANDATEENMANEENLYALLKAITASRAIGFESDAATDFTPWGLTRPFLTLRLAGYPDAVPMRFFEFLTLRLADFPDGVVFRSFGFLKFLTLRLAEPHIVLRFGMDGKGGYFVNRLGTPTVMRVDESLVAAIAVRPYEWRHSRLWSVTGVNLFAIKRKTGAASPLILKYKYLDESWQAECDGKDLSATLNPAWVNFMLKALEELRVSRWLSPTDEAAATALANPSLTFTVFEDEPNDDEDEPAGVAIHKLTLAPVGPRPAFYFGRLDKYFGSLDNYFGRFDGGSHLFLISRETYQNLAGELFEKE